MKEESFTGKIIISFFSMIVILSFCLVGLGIVLPHLMWG